MFDFQFESVKEVPARKGGAGGAIKYDWSKFPPPDKDGIKSAFIASDHKKATSTLHTSIKRYKERLLEAGTKEADLPVFELRQERDEKTGEISGVTVYRTK